VKIYDFYALWLPKHHFIRIFGFVSIYRCSAGVMFGHYFQEDIANDSAVSGVLVWGDHIQGGR